MAKLLKAAYSDGSEVPTVFLGSGDIKISTVIHEEEGFIGVAFSQGHEGEIGRGFPEDCGKKLTELDVLVQVLSTKKESLIVLKEQCENSIKLFDPEYEKTFTASEVNALLDKQVKACADKFINEGKHDPIGAILAAKLTVKGGI